jgi:hypothetical protein
MGEPSLFSNDLMSGSEVPLANGCCRNRSAFAEFAVRHASVHHCSARPDMCLNAFADAWHKCLTGTPSYKH